jgi:hypothetical protein
VMRDGIAMRARERLCPKFWLIFLRRHDLYPSTESFENSPGYHNAKVPSGRLLDVG